MKLHDVLPHLFLQKTILSTVLITSLAGALFFVATPAIQNAETTETTAAAGNNISFSTEQVSLPISSTETGTKQEPSIRLKETTAISDQTTPVTAEATTMLSEMIISQEPATSASIPTVIPSVTEETTALTTKVAETKVSETMLPTDAPETVVATIPAPTGSFDDSMARAVLDVVNARRAENGLSALTWNDTLAESASIRAPEIVICWDHTRPDGSPWYTAGAQMEMGENLAYGQTSVEQVMKEWMESPSHAENILREDYTEIGVSCYLENGVYYWVQHFA